MLLNNVYESFAVLVINRLRAYSHFLAHQRVFLARDPSVDPTAMALSVEQRIKAGSMRQWPDCASSLLRLPYPTGN